MTKRLSAGVLLAACAVFFTALTADAARPVKREWRGKEDPATLPLFFRSSAGTTWIDVGQSCANEDTLNSTHSPDQVWCFEGASGDSTWPSVGVQGVGDWDHWSLYAPPITPGSKWHVSNRHTGTLGGTYNAWCGCDSLNGNPACTDMAFWTFKEGYDDDWDYSLELDMSGQNATTGGTIEFDLRYDSECDYDYTYLEYFNTTPPAHWQTIAGAGGRLAQFNTISGNKDDAHGGTGRAGCGDDYFFHSDTVNGTDPYHGNSIWLENISFTMPSSSTGMRLRWHCTSDQGWSDQDGGGDTDGIAAIDNVTVTFNASGSVVSDNFETDSFLGVTATIGTAQWIAHALEGQTYDGWHMRFDPKYTNKGNTCTFSNDWMYSSKPGGPIPVNGFNYYLTSPKIYSDGWNGGVVEYSNYLCQNTAFDDATDTLMRVYKTGAGWSLWNSFDGNTIIVAGCEFWNMNDFEDLTVYLGTEVDSFQLAFVQLDFSEPGDFWWDEHGGTTFLIDNVSIGQFDGSATIFTARQIDIPTDTFSRVIPAHSANLNNKEEGDWIGNGGTRTFAKGDSLTLQIDDVDGLHATGVRAYWRVGNGTPPTFGSWQNKLMSYGTPSPGTLTQEGTYRTTFGNTTTEDYSADEAGSLGNPVLDPIWDPGQTIQYYIQVTDDSTDVQVFPNTADDTPTAQYLQFQILPQNRTVGGGVNVLIVDDYMRNNLDFENSTGFDAGGGVGLGTFSEPAFDAPEDQVEQALALIYGGSEDYVAGVYGTPKWDIYNCGHAGFNLQHEPRITSFVDDGLGGIANDLSVPNYDAVIWLHGSFDSNTLADTTRLDLMPFLDAGGRLFTSGNDVAFDLGSGGNDSDSTIGFLADYLGISLSDPLDDETGTRRLNVEGVASTSLAGLKLGLYGECPGIRMAFDRLSKAADSTNVTTLATYEASVTGTNGRAAIIKKQLTSALRVNTGVTVTAGFGLESLVTDMARACLISKVFVSDFGLPNPAFACTNSGTDAPVVANGRFGFDLAQASPNPFSEATSIHFSVPGRTHVSIEIYNILGQKVRTLVDETLEGNSYVREWDGRADAGARVSSGIYFYKMVAGDYSATRKAVMLK